ncbi:MAG: DUF6485 family protein [Eubacteriales bacterium]|nr:DUF6485 family protein [Eubacteriales bacterium]
MSCNANKTIKCPCTYSCRRHGKCCECVAYHQRSGEFPACFFSEQVERTYDRSFRALAADRSGGK